MWEELIKRKRIDENKLWCVMGDCNDVRKNHERKGTT